MTTNQDRAAEVIEGYYPPCQTCRARATVGIPEVGECDECAKECQYIAQALADDDLLSPDLPEPEMDIDRLIWRVGEEGFVYRKPDGRISTVGVGNPYPSMEIARRHALAVIAATNYYNTQEQA